jgi:hypothetical protein
MNGTKNERKIMGLAASQARFLAITSRKMNCEFQSTQIAQEKLSVTRDLQQAAEDYQSSLSATKLVWEDSDSNEYNLTYDLMMTPSAINQYDPYLITDTQGKIVLSDSMYSAAVKAGIIDETTGASKVSSPAMGETTSTDDGSRNAFLYQLGISNVIDGSTVSSIQNLGDDGYSKSGIGGTVYDKSTSNALTTSAFISYLSQTYKEADVTPPYKDSSDPSLGRVASSEYIYGLNLVDILGSNYTYSDTTELKNANEYCITKNGQTISESSASSLTLGDILNGKYELSYKGGDMRTIVQNILSSMADSLGKDYTGSDPKGLNVDAESDSALTTAYEFTLSQYNTTNYATSKNSSRVYDLYTLAQKQNNIINGKDDKSSVSLTNMLKSYLTNFAIAIDGYDCGFGIDTTSSSKSTYVTDDLNYYFLLANDGAMTDKTSLTADFYNMLYNQLCVNGASSDATKRSLVEDSSYLTNSLKSGQLFISSLNNDGYFYQEAYSLNGHVTEVTDEDAVARAELEYNVTKSKLNYKEETLELEMKNLDTEISALTTEYDTVKSLISKNIEKVFTMFSS